MRSIMAAVVVCVGMVSVWAGGSKQSSAPVPRSATKHGGGGTLGSTQPRLGSTENWLRAQEGRDFQNSSIFEGKAFGTKYLFRWIKSGTFQMGSTRRTTRMATPMRPSIK